MPFEGFRMDVEKNCLLTNFCLLIKADFTIKYRCDKKDTDPYNISPIEMRSLWMEIRYIKSAVRLLNRDWVNKWGLDLSKEVLWVSVDQRQQIYMLSKLKDDLIICESNPGCTCVARGGLRGRIFFRSPTLTACSFAALWPRETHSTSFERSKPYLLTQSLSKSLAPI